MKTLIIVFIKKLMNYSIINIIKLFKNLQIIIIYFINQKVLI